MPHQGYEDVRQLRELGVLVDDETQWLNPEKCVVTAICGDGKRSRDVVEHQARFCVSARHDPWVHIVAVNGGPLAIPSGSPLNARLPKGEVVLEEIADAVVLQRTEYVNLIIHHPCGMAKRYCLNVFACIRMLMEARTIVMRRIAPLVIGEGIADRPVVGGFIHVDYKAIVEGEFCGRGMNTYRVSKHVWDAWLRVPTDFVVGETTER